MPETGYPTEAELQRIKDWSIKNNSDIEELVRFIHSIWWSADWGYSRRKKYLYLSTGGWSGNEEIISVLQDTMFWMLCWESSRRGGHYKFRLNRIAESKETANAKG